MTDPLGSRLADIDERIAAAAGSVGRDAAEICRIVVTKFHGAELVRRLSALGVRDVGENRQQELNAKVDELHDLTGVNWHFVGQAQTNKARAIRRVASVVHSLDRARLADAFEAAAGPGDPQLDVLIQVNLTDDAGRGGVAEADVRELAEHVAGLPSLRVRGVMGVAAVGVAPAASFARLARSAEALRSAVPDARWISAGMSGDFEEAIVAGATHLRIGTAITGTRPDRG